MKPLEQVNGPSMPRGVDRDFVLRCVPVLGNNLVYIFGVVFLSWKVFDILLLFWIENLVLGVFGLQRLLLSRRPGFFHRLYLSAGYAIALTVYSLVYGLFAWVNFSGLDVPGNREASLAAIRAALTQPDVLNSAAGLCVFQGYDFLFGFLARGRFRRVNVEREMRHVGIRMFLLTVGLVLGGGILLQHGSALPTLVVLVILKAGVEAGFVWHDRILDAEDLMAEGERYKRFNRVHGMAESRIAAQSTDEKAMPSALRPPPLPKGGAPQARLDKG